MQNMLMVMSIGFLVLGCAGSRPANLGVTNGSLTPCPASPNCVCSQYPDPSHSIAPLPYKVSAQEARTRLLAVIAGMKRTKVVTAAEFYLHVEFTSALFRFVDDVEFLIDDTQKVIHMRSASRVGYSDLGVNRKRMEAIRQLFNKED